MLKRAQVWVNLKSRGTLHCSGNHFLRINKLLALCSLKHIEQLLKKMIPNLATN